MKPKKKKRIVKVWKILKGISTFLFGIVMVIFYLGLAIGAVIFFLLILGAIIN